jgi:hypothetical protein
MRVLLTTIGSRGDFQSIAVLAARLRERGGEVPVCAPPDAEFADLLNEHRAGVALPPVHSVRDYIYAGRPWPATDPVLAPRPGPPADVVQTGAWLLEEGR